LETALADVSQGAHDVCSDVRDRPSLAARRPAPLLIRQRTDQCLEAAQFLELTRDDVGTRQRHGALLKNMRVARMLWDRLATVNRDLRDLRHGARRAGG